MANEKMWRNVKSTLQALKEFLTRYEFFVFFDTETTGLKPEKDSVIQLSGLVVNRKLEVVEKFDELCNPSPNIISPLITELTGISNSDVENARPERAVLTDFLAKTKGCGYFAYNSPFDTKMVEGSMRKYGVNIKLDHFDVLRLARDVLANEAIENHKLKTVSDYLGVTPEGEAFHNALFDVESTVRVFKALMERVKQMSITEGNLRPKIFSIRPWGYGKMQRLYVQTSLGSVWFDKIRGNWGTKDAPIDDLDMAYIEGTCLEMAAKAGYDGLSKVDEAI